MHVGLEIIVVLYKKNINEKVLNKITYGQLMDVLAEEGRWNDEKSTLNNEE